MVNTPHPCAGCPSCAPKRCEVVQSWPDGLAIWLLHEEGCHCCRTCTCLMMDCDIHLDCAVRLMKGYPCVGGRRDIPLQPFLWLDATARRARGLIVELSRWMARPSA